MNLLDREHQTLPPGAAVKITQSLCARDATLHDENDAEFDRVLAAFRQEHQPVGPTEDYLVQQIVAAYWKTRRLTRLEAGVLSHQSDDPDVATLPEHEPPIESTPHSLHDLDTMALGIAVHKDCNSGNVLVKLTNCASITDRLFHRSLLQLQRLQSRRLERASVDKVA